MPSASAIGSSSPSDVRSRSEYSSCSAVTGAQPRKPAIVWACAATQAGASEKRADAQPRAAERDVGVVDEFEELAALATMSVSSFHRHFRAVTSMTPIQFQKQIRLREARARLLAQPGEITGLGFAGGTA